MKFSTLAGMVGGGVQTPGFLGHSKLYLGSPKFISAEGGLRRVVWLNRELKEELAACSASPPGGTASPTPRPHRR